MSDQETTTTEKLPEWLEGAARRATTAGEAFYKTPFRRYTKPRVAPLAADTSSALGRLRSYAADPGAAVEPFINPHTDAVLAPAIRNIENARAAEASRIGTSQQFAGGYGDARHGIREARLAEDTSRAIGDVTANVKSQAYEAGTSRFQEMLASLLSAGGLQQKNVQDRYDTDYEEFMREEQSPYDKLAALLSSVSGVPFSRTSVRREPNSAPAGILGALLGAFA